MALGDIPPWLSVSPAFFTQALEAGARAGIAVADQNQRAAAMAEARAERAAQMAQREAEQAERQRQFEASRLLDIQRLAQTAAHQQAQEAAQAAQESRLLDFNKGRLAQDAAELAQRTGYQSGQLAAENRRLALAEKEFAEPTMALDTKLVEAIDPATKKRVGLFGRVGPKTQHFIADPVDKPLSDAQRMPGYNAMERGILSELDSIDMLAAARNPAHPKHARYGELIQQLEAVRRGRSTLMGDSALLPAPVATNAAPVNTNSVLGTFTRDAEGKLKWTPK